MSHSRDSSTPFTSLSLLQYGLLGWAIGAVAVPIYIQVPFLYSRVYEVPTAWVGLILLGSRLFDAITDPIIGLWVDRRAGNPYRYSFPLLLSIPFLIFGMYGVFFPFGNSPLDYAVSLAISLNVVHIGYSFASIAYQAWGSELGNSDKVKSQFVAVREGIGILGVIFAVSLALESHAPLIFTVFASMLMVGMLLLLKFAPRPLFSNSQTAVHAGLHSSWQQITAPLAHQNFRRLMAVFLCNGLAAALPATLVPFYLRDRLGLGESDQWVLAVYFLVGALSTVFWVKLAGKIGLAKAWLLSMVISIPAFILVVLLNRGDLMGYLGVCILTGFALGADLSLPAALVARLIDDNQQRGKNEGGYFGLWNWVNKLNLALAPSVALGVLQWFNYQPDHTTTSTFNELGLAAQVMADPLIWMYALIPCLLKLIAIFALARSGLTKLVVKQVQEEPFESTLGNQHANT